MDDNEKNSNSNHTKGSIDLLIQKAEQIQKDIQDIKNDLKYFKKYFEKQGQNKK